MTLNRARERRRDGGFSLIELLTIIVIIGILASIAIPLYLSQRQKAQLTQGKSDLRNVANAEQAYMAENDHYLDTATPAADLSGIVLSKDVTSVVVKTLKTDGTLAGSNGTGGFCAIATVTGNTQHVYYNTMLGGLTSTACP